MAWYSWPSLISYSQRTQIFVTSAPYSVVGGSIRTVGDAPDWR